MVKGISWVSGFSLLFQGIIIAFLSYLIWFELVHRYSVTILHAFSFFTPVFGVIISGIFILHEPITSSIIAALIFVSAGTILVNHNPESNRVREVLGDSAMVCFLRRERGKTAKITAA